MGTAVLPLEAERLFPEASGLMLAWMMSAIGISQLVCPIAGRLSDAHRSKYGKRRPYIVFGIALSCVSFIAMWVASELMSPGLYVLALFCAMSGLNIAYSAAAALVPDLTGGQSHEMGELSGYVGAQTLFGCLSGFCFLLATYSLDYHTNYAYYVVGLIISGLLICNLVKEKPTDRHSISLGEGGEVDEQFRWNCSSLAATFTIDCSEGYDFLWVFIGRTLFYIATSCTSFVLFYVRDVVQVENVIAQKYIVGVMGLSAQFIGGITAALVGKVDLSVKYGRKKMVYYACVNMMVVYMLFIICPFVYQQEQGFSFNNYWKGYMKRFKGFQDSFKEGLPALETGKSWLAIPSAKNLVTGEEVGSEALETEGKWSIFGGASAEGENAINKVNNSFFFPTHKFHQYFVRLGTFLAGFHEQVDAAPVAVQAVPGQFMVTMICCFVLRSSNFKTIVEHFHQNDFDSKIHR